MCLGVHSRATDAAMHLPGGLADRLAALLLTTVQQLPLYKQRQLASMISLVRTSVSFIRPTMHAYAPKHIYFAGQYWEQDCHNVRALLDAIVATHLHAMTNPDWLPLLGMTALPGLPRPRQRPTTPVMLRAQRPGPLPGLEDVDVSSLYMETGLGEACQLVEALRGHYSPLVGVLCGRLDQAVGAALKRLAEGDVEGAFGEGAATYCGHERLAMLAPALDAFAAAPYRCVCGRSWWYPVCYISDFLRPSPDTLALLDACVTTHEASLSLSDMQRYVTWCLAVSHPCPQPMLHAAASRLLQRLLTHPVRPPPQASPPCFVAQQARWLHAQQVAAVRIVAVRNAHRWAAYPTRVAFWDPEGASYMVPAFEGVAARLLWGLACHWAAPSAYCAQVCGGLCMLRCVGQQLYTQVTQWLTRYLAASFTPQLEEHLMSVYLTNVLVELQGGGRRGPNPLQANAWTSGASLLAAALSELRQLGDSEEGDQGQCVARLLHLLLPAVCHGCSVCLCKHSPTTQGCGLMPDAGRRAQWTRFQEEVQAAVGAVSGAAFLRHCFEHPPPTICRGGVLPTGARDV